MNMRITASTIFLIQVLTCCLLSACNNLGSTRVMHTPETMVSVREFLVADQREATQYGFYTYVLLREARNTSNEARYQAAADAFLGISQRQHQRFVPEWQLNLTYFPVNDMPTVDVVNVSAGTSSNDKTRSSAVEWLIAHHNYGRSEAFLRDLRADGDAGPYLVASRYPMSQLQDGTPVQYLALGRFEPELIRRAVSVFLEQVSRPHRWTNDSVKDWSLELCNFLVRTGKAFAQVAAAVRVIDSVAGRDHVPDNKHSSSRSVSTR